jgi:RNA polymerase sigma-70 factor (ECF subfamily)
MLKTAIRLRLDPAVRRRVDESDIVQETQLEAFRRLSTYLARPDQVSFRLWLRGIALDQLVSCRRREVEAQKRSVHREMSLPAASSVALAYSLIAGTSSPSQHVSKQEVAKLVRLVVAELPEQDREIILLRNFEGMTNQEAAQVLSVKPVTASKRYGRAVQRLQQRLLEAGFSGIED